MSEKTELIEALKGARDKGDRPAAPDADLRWADLRGAAWDGLAVDNLPSGNLTLVPSHLGWHIQIGCWSGTPDELRDLIAKDKDWPEAEGCEIERRRPFLEAALALCQVHMDDRSEAIDQLKEKWGEEA